MFLWLSGESDGVALPITYPLLLSRTPMRSFLLSGAISTAILAFAATGLEACSIGDEGVAAGANQEVVSSTVNVLTSRNDTARTAANLNEKVLTTRNVNAQSFGRLFSRPVDGQIWSQPLYVSNVNGKNLVFVATEHNSVYAFDADDTRENAPPVWTKNLGPTVPASDTQCGLLGPEVGITATPVIDPASKTIWFTTRNKENGQFLHKLHALDIATGAPRAGSPRVITAQAPGTGDASSGGMVRLDGLRNMQRPGLLKVGNRIFIAFASLCDIRPYHGWVLGYDATTLEQTHVHVTTPNGSAGGIWSGGVGINADENGDIYYVSGDVYGPTTGEFGGANNLGNSMVHLKDTGSKLELVTKFTPFDTRTQSPRDRSLGNGGGILIPGTHLMVAGDKRGIHFLVDRDDMGGSADQDGQIVQKWQAVPDVTTHGGTHSGTAFYKKGTGGTYYMWGIGDNLRAYKFDGQKFDTRALVNPETKIGFPGGAISISANGEQDGTAVLWAIRGKRTSPGLAASTGAGVLAAFDANDITKQLWSSDDVASDQLGTAAKFNPPTIANGRVFVGTASNQLVVYGLKNGSTTPDPNAQNPDPGTEPGNPTGQAYTFTRIYNEILGPGTPGHCSGTGGCHTQERGGFKCGTTKASCYIGLVQAGLIDPGNPAASVLADPAGSPLVWFGGGMPLDNPEDNPAAAAAVKSWIAAGAKND